MRFTRMLSLALLLSCLSTPPVFAQMQGSAGLTDREVRLLYGEFNKVQSFGLIAISLVGDAEKIGLTRSALKAYAIEQFKNDFCQIKFEDLSLDLKRFTKLISVQDPKTGIMTFRVWVVGDGSSLAYHVRCDAGNFRNYTIWSEEVLGHGAEATAPKAIEEIMAEMMKQLAISFFRARDEKCP